MNSPELPNYGVILPTYNTRDLTMTCIGMLLQSHHPPTTVAVVDNGTDGTADIVEASYPSIHVVRSPVNTGFASAINTGSQLIKEPFILWLNSDVFLDRDDMSLLLSEADGQSDLAAIAPRQVALEGQALPSVYRFPSALRPFRSKRPRLSVGRVRSDEFLSGACLLLRRSAWAETGPLDDSFFFYWEESDWQFRARKLGWELALAGVTVRHVGGGSGDGHSTTLRLLSSEGYERFILKHEGRAALLLHRFTNLPGVLWNVLGTLAWRAGPGDEVLAQDALAARARLAQLIRPVPPREASPWAARVRGER
jgi:GT2 family glycosyltransferase